MITKTKAYTSSDGQVHATLAGAQTAEILRIFENYPKEGEPAWSVNAIVVTIIANADKIKDVLTTGSRSRPGARAINRATRTTKRKAKPVVDIVKERVAHERVAGAYKEMRSAVDTAVNG